MRASFFISVGGVDVTGNFNPAATDISVTDSSGEAADTASISLADEDGRIVLPREGAEIAIGLGWDAPTLIFEGFVDSVNSDGSRGGGRTLSVAAKSADTVKGKLKEQNEKHEDDKTLGAVASKWAKEAGLGEMFVHGDLAGIEREYWSMNNESFPAWGERIAKSLGATFKVMGSRGIMVPRSAGISASGKALVPIVARYGENLLSWSIRPAIGRPQHVEFRTRRFDIPEGQWKEKKKGASYDTQAEAISTFRFPELDDPQSEERADSNEKESDRERGGGSAEILGDPAATAEAPCQIVGARPGVDGTYRIDSVTHTYSRGSGFHSALTLKQPKGGAGTDSR